MNDVNDILNNLGKGPLGGLSINLISLLKVPVIIVLIGNLLFSALLFLRSRILADTFESSSNGIIKTIVLGYIVLTVIGSIVTVLFLLIG
jgi:hypothetical protein